jgi:hypothetical protein
MKLEFHLTDDVGFNYRPKPDYSDLKFQIQNDKGKGKLSCSGNIVFYGSDYTDLTYVLGTGYDYRIDIYNKGTIFLTVDYKSVTVTSQNESLKKISIQIKPDTIYTLDAWTNYDKEYNINELAPEAALLSFEQGHFPIENDTGNLFNDVPLNIAGGLTEIQQANWDIYGVVNLGTTYVSGGIRYYRQIAVHYRRQVGYGYYIGTTKYDPEGNIYVLGDWIYLADITYDGRAIPKYKRDITPAYDPTPNTEPYSDIYNTTAYYNDYSILYTGVTRTVISVIAFLFAKIGISVSIDTTGTSTDSYYSFKNLTGETLTYGGISTNKYMNRLLIANLTDFVPADDDGQKDVPASETMVSLKTILEFFERRGFEWWIEDRSGTDYFMLKHKFHKSLGSGNPNLANYKGRNWNRENSYEIENPEFHKIVNDGENNSIDFKGTDLVMSEVYGTDASSSFNDNNVFIDLDDIAQRRHDVYDEFGNNNIVIIAAQSGMSYDHVRQGTGLLSLIPKNNSELSYSFTCRALIADLPDTSVSVNGSSFTAEKWRLKKRSKVTVNIPTSVNILIDFDVQDYVSHYVDSCEIEQISQKANENIYNLTLMK